MTLYATVRIEDLHARCGYADDPRGALPGACGDAARYVVRQVKGEGDWALRCMRHAGWWALSVPIREQSPTIELPRHSGHLSGVPDSVILSTRELLTDRGLRIPMTVPTVDEIEAMPEFRAIVDANGEEIDRLRTEALAAAQGAYESLLLVGARLRLLRSDEIYDVEVAEGPGYLEAHQAAAEAAAHALLREIERRLGTVG